jgi:hypothetical protein
MLGRLAGSLWASGIQGNHGGRDCSLRNLRKSDDILFRKDDTFLIPTLYKRPDVMLLPSHAPIHQFWLTRDTECKSDVTNTCHLTEKLGVSLTLQGLNFTWIIYKHSVCTSQGTHRFSATNTSQLMQFTVRTKWNTQIQSFGRIQSWRMLKRVVHIRTTEL